MDVMYTYNTDIFRGLKELHNLLTDCCFFRSPKMTLKRSTGSLEWTMRTYRN